MRDTNQLPTTKTNKTRCFEYLLFALIWVLSAGEPAQNPHSIVESFDA